MGYEETTRGNEMTPKQIKQLRKKLGESQVKFAERVGVRQATVAEWETGKKKPSPLAETVLAMICEKSA